MINARAETLAEKPAFKDLLGKRRCLVLADGFYEWRKEGKGKVPMRFKLKSGEPFAFAGLWDTWKSPDGNLLRTYTIVTTEPNDVLRPIHNRMPAMLSNGDAQKWLADNDEIAHALTLLKPFPADAMEHLKCDPEKREKFELTGSMANLRKSDQMFIITPLFLFNGDSNSVDLVACPLTYFGARVRRPGIQQFQQ